MKLDKDFFYFFCRSVLVPEGILVQQDDDKWHIEMTDDDTLGIDSEEEFDTFESCVNYLMEVVQHEYKSS